MGGRARLLAWIGAGLIVGFGVGLIVAQVVPPFNQAPPRSTQSGSAPVSAASPSPDASTQEPTSSAPALVFPTAETTGVPAGWVPKQSISGDYTIDTDGAVVEDLRVTGGVLYVRGLNVTLRRVQVVGGRIVNDYGRTCFNGLRIEDSEIVRGDSDTQLPAIESGGYTLERVKIDGPSEGARAGELASGCGPVVVQDSWFRITPPDKCVAKHLDWHGDGLQGYMGPEVVVRNSFINLAEVPGCQGTSAFFYPDQGNVRATVENLVVAGGGYPFRLYTPGTVSGLKVVDGSWDYDPVDVDCSQVTWGTGNEIVRTNPDGTVTPLSHLECQSH